jgi:hypothetical protein
MEEEKILIVTEYGDFITSCRKLLKGIKHNGHEIKVLSAADGGAACILLHENPDIKVVLLDYVTEQAVFNYIKQHLKNDSIQIMINTSTAKFFPTGLIGKKYSSDDFIARYPIDINRIRTAVSTRLNNYDNLTNSVAKTKNAP